MKLSLKDKLKELRLKNKYNQKELAKDLEVNQNTISRWEKGEREPDLNQIMNICLKLNTTPNELLINEQISNNYLTYQENELLDKYQQLDEDNKKAAIKNIDGLILLQKSSLKLIPKEKPQFYKAVGRQGTEFDIPKEQADKLDDIEGEEIDV